MLVFFVKQIMNVRKAIVGRNEPAQLAWGVAFGILLGVVPHGNLLAIGLLLLVLSLKLNHGMATVAAVATTFMATRLDPYSHQVGRFVLTHPDFSRHLANAWQMPLVPWTDINNTVVVGSLLIGVAALLQAFLLTYPVFHFFAPKGTPVHGAVNAEAAVGQGAVAARDQQVRVDAAAPAIAGMHAHGAHRAQDSRAVEVAATSTTRLAVASSGKALEPSAIDAAMSGLVTSRPAPPRSASAQSTAAGPGAATSATAHMDAASPQATRIDASHAVTGSPSVEGSNVSGKPAATTTEPQLIETRIDVIRVGKRKPAAEPEKVEFEDVSKQDEPMSEALSYLLRQLRDSQDRRAA